MINLVCGKLNVYGKAELHRQSPTDARQVRQPPFPSSTDSHKTDQVLQVILNTSRGVPVCSMACRGVVTYRSLPFSQETEDINRCGLRLDPTLLGSHHIHTSGRDGFLQQLQSRTPRIDPIPWA